MKTSIGVFLIFSLILAGFTNAQAQPVNSPQQKLEALHEQIKTLRQQIKQEKETAKLAQMKQKLLQLQQQMREAFGAMAGSGTLELGNQYVGPASPNSSQNMPIAT